MPDVSKTDDVSRLGLGAQISVLFAIGGLLVSILLGAATLVLTRQQLLETRGSAAAAMAEELARGMGGLGVTAGSG